MGHPFHLFLDKKLCFYDTFEAGKKVSLFTKSHMQIFFEDVRSPAHSPARALAVQPSIVFIAKYAQKYQFYMKNNKFAEGGARMDTISVIIMDSISSSRAPERATVQAEQHI